MLIPILSVNGELPEWAMIELQGDLETYDAVGDLKERFIGDLHYEKNAEGTPVLIVGMHILHGKEANLGKPFVLLEKKSNVCNTDGKNTTEYTVKGIVKRKLVFRIRPIPIVTGVPISS